MFGQAFITLFFGRVSTVVSSVAGCEPARGEVVRDTEYVRDKRAALKKAESGCLHDAKRHVSNLTSSMTFPPAFLPLGDPPMLPSPPISSPQHLLAFA